MATAVAAGEGPTLKRSIGVWQLAFYGLGGMLGAGIYGLIGVAAGQMGNTVWLAFLVSMVVALLTGLSYANVGSRYPRAGGAAYVTARAYGTPMLTYVVGLAVMCSGLTSIAAQSRVAAENLQRLLGLEALPLELLAIAFLLVLAGIVFRGISECMWLNMVCTAVEASGLVIVIAVGASYWGSVDLLEIPPPQEGGDVFALVIMQGAVLTFFSFIGFEDILNVAEEVKEPQRTIPMGLLLAMSAAAVLYLAVAVTAVSVVPWRELGEVESALTEVVARAAPAFPEALFIIITIFAVTNTALLNYVMGSRLAYGMARQGLLPSFLGRVHPSRRTPHLAVAVLLAILVVLMLVGNISQLASATTLLLLTVFTIVNTALVILKRRPGERRSSFEVPIFVPVLGAIVCAVLVVVRVTTGSIAAPLMAGAIILVILGLYVALRPRSVVID